MNHWVSTQRWFPKIFFGYCNWHDSKSETWLNWTQIGNRDKAVDPKRKNLLFSILAPRLLAHLAPVGSFRAAQPLWQNFSPSWLGHLLSVFCEDRQRGKAATRTCRCPQERWGRRPQYLSGARMEKLHQLRWVASDFSYVTCNNSNELYSCQTCCLLSAMVMNLFLL